MAAGTNTGAGDETDVIELRNGGKEFEIEVEGDPVWCCCCLEDVCGVMADNVSLDDFSPSLMLEVLIETVAAFLAI